MGLVGLTNGSGSGNVAICSSIIRTTSIIILSPAEDPNNIKVWMRYNEIANEATGKGWHFRIRFQIAGTTSADTRARTYFLILNPV